MNQNEGRKTAGEHLLSLTIDHLKPGLYYYSMRAEEFVKTRCMLIIN